MRYLVFFLSLMFLASCSSDCVQDKFDAFKDDYSDCSMAKISKYRFNDRTVYGLLEGNCVSDGGEQIFDENCVEICYLWGIGGFSNCEGLEWTDNAELIEVTWEN